MSISAGDAMADLGPAISQMAAEIRQMAGDFRSIAGSMGSMSASSNRFSAGGAGEGGGGVDLGRVGSGIAKGGIGGAVEVAGAVVKGALGLTKDVAVASFNDLRIGRGEALEYERQRLIGRTGTGDFTRFKDNLNISMNDINVQSRQQMTADLANAFSSYYSQGMGGGIAGERRTAMAIGSMHTLASVSGVSAEAVGGATGSLYSSQAYYRAMASGVMTRNPITGDMLSPEEIANQYRQRFKNNTPEEIKRALGPGGMLRAEMTQTWGDQNLVEMISKGIVMTAESGKALVTGDVQSTAMDLGYAGTKYTRGKDTESLKEGEKQNRVGEYTNDITAGIATSNKILADINAKLADPGSAAARAFLGATETFGGFIDTFNTDMPQTTQLVMDTLTKAMGDLAGAFLSLDPLSMASAGIGAITSLGTLAAIGGIGLTLTHGAARGEPARTGDYPSGMGGEGTQFMDPYVLNSLGLDPQGKPLPYSNGLTTGTIAAPGDPVRSLWPTNLEQMPWAYNDVDPNSRPSWWTLPDNMEDWPTILPDNGAPAAPLEETPVDEGAPSDTDISAPADPNAPPAEETPAESSRRRRRSGPTVIINLTIQRATDQEAIKFARLVKQHLKDDEELYAIGNGTFAGASNAG